MVAKLSEFWWWFYREPVGGPFSDVSIRHILVLTVLVYAAHC